MCDIHTCDISHICDLSKFHDSSICVTWRIHMCDMPHSYVWQHAFVYATCLIHVWSMILFILCMVRVNKRAIIRHDVMSLRGTSFYAVHNQVCVHEPATMSHKLCLWITLCPWCMNHVYESPTMSLRGTSFYAVHNWVRIHENIWVSQSMSKSHEVCLSICYHVYQSSIMSMNRDPFLWATNFLHMRDFILCGALLGVCTREWERKMVHGCSVCCIGRCSVCCSVCCSVSASVQSGF